MSALAGWRPSGKFWVRLCPYVPLLELSPHPLKLGIRVPESCEVLQQRYLSFLELSPRPLELVIRVLESCEVLQQRYLSFLELSPRPLELVIRVLESCEVLQQRYLPFLELSPCPLKLVIRGSNPVKFGNSTLNSQFGVVTMTTFRLIIPNTTTGNDSRTSGSRCSTLK